MRKGYRFSFEETDTDERTCAEEYLRELMNVHEKLNGIERTMHIEEVKGTAELPADLAEFVHAVGDLAVRYEVLTSLLRLSRTPERTITTLNYMKGTFCDAIDKHYGEGSGAVLYDEPFVFDHLIPYCTLPGAGKEENLYSWYRETFIDGPHFRKYQQRQVRVYCNFFPLSTRTVAHFCLASSGQATQFTGSVPMLHTRKFSQKAKNLSDVDHDLGFNSENYPKYLQGQADAVKSGYYSPFCHIDEVIKEIAESYKLTEDQVVVELPRGEETRSVNAGANLRSLAKAKDEGMRLLDTEKDHAEKLGHRSYIILVFDANGKCSQWYHFNSDTSKGCKCTIEQINKQLQTEQHPVAMRHLSKDLTFLQVRAVRMAKRSSDDTADAPDTTEVTGATDATNATIAKPHKKKRKVPSEKHQVIFTVLEDWLDAGRSKQDMFRAGAHVSGLLDGLEMKTIISQSDRELAIPFQVTDSDEQIVETAKAYRGLPILLGP